MIDCLLFDNDGTLVDSEYLCNKAIAIKFKEFGVDLSVERLVTDYRGKELAIIFAELASIHNVELPPLFITEYRALVTDLFNSELKPIAGVVEALESLDFPKAVVSNAPREKIILALDICGLRKYFGDNIYSAYDNNIFKPDPALYLHAATDMGFSPKQCAVIEDSLLGVEAGVNADMKTFFYNSHNENCPFPAAINFTAMKNLPNLINK
ncbi:HAD-IA family hydrolase [Colwellia sp. E2M01]|uniref:HAD-IA family hydrolase n=1 Tax=Colwellia sp. E2M01 TaxID=2841561 RepID=UPI001C08C6D9|nr:HAD-IA family hydrolase [Colwellia sp. E2M01]MBU2872067.1 HAD-IA family hydrolase [Colwellia sp. E2M01]